MSELNEIIVYLWFIPVTLQIVLPLAVFVIWFIGRIPALLISGADVHERSVKTVASKT